jgi:hypothetical protein
MSLFGNTLRQVGSDLGIVSERPYKEEITWGRPRPPAEKERPPTEREERPPAETERRTLRREGGGPLRAVMQIVVSLIVLGGGIYVLLEGDKDAGQAAAGIMGIVVGYWLR